MDWVSGWIQGIIIAVIISTIIEMILPEGTSKKYIKVVIGVYILFSIVSPVISKVTGNNFKISNILDLDEYIEASKNSGSMKNQLDEQNQNQIKDIYLSSIKNDIKEKVQTKGYMVSNLTVEVENDEQYTLKKLQLQITKSSNTASNNESTNQIVENVNEIKVSIGAKQNNHESSNTTEKAKKNTISNQEKKELKEYLSSVYEISTKNIFINE